MGGFALACLIGLAVRPGIAAEAPAEPSLLSVFPLGGQAGKTFRTTIRGRSLDGAHALWFNDTALEARVLSGSRCLS